MTIGRLLVAIDFSPCAAMVARRAGQLAQQLGARPTLLHVVPSPRVPPETEIEVDDAPGEGGTQRMSVQDYLRTSAERRMQRYVAMMGEHDFGVRSVVRFGEPADEILEEVRDSGADMIALGTHARRGVARAVYGSVAEDITRHADAPVVTFRSKWDATCDAKSCNWCVEGTTPEDLRVDAEQDG